MPTSRYAQTSWQNNTVAALYNPHAILVEKKTCLHTKINVKIDRVGHNIPHDIFYVTLEMISQPITRPVLVIVNKIKQ